MSDSEKLVKVINGLLNVMEIQERRHSNEFHLSAEAFTPLWEQAKKDAQTAVSEVVATAHTEKPQGNQLVVDYLNLLPDNVIDLLEGFVSEATKSGFQVEFQMYQFATPILTIGVYKRSGAQIPPEMYYL